MGGQEWLCHCLFDGAEHFPSSSVPWNQALPSRVGQRRSPVCRLVLSKATWLNTYYRRLGRSDCGEPVTPTRSHIWRVGSQCCLSVAPQLCASCGSERAITCAGPHVPSRLSGTAETKCFFFSFFFFPRNCTPSQWPKWCHLFWGEALLDFCCWGKEVEKKKGH